MQTNETISLGKESRLEKNTLMEAAQQITGMSDWGSDDSFEIGLEKLVDAFEATSYADQMRQRLSARLIQTLITRLKLREDERKNPEITKSPIERPLIVCGLPRTGTTWLHDLLALDPVSRAPLEWEVASPWPAPEVKTYKTDPRIIQMQKGIDGMLEAAPELATMHAFSSTLPAECNNITEFHFATPNFWAAYGVPEYLKWVTNEEKPQGVMATHRRVLQQLQWKGPRGRWTLKSPPHLLMLKQLLAEYPDACLIQTHREPTKMVASLTSMIRSLRKVQLPDIPELHEPQRIAQEVLYHFGEALERGADSRQNPEIDNRFIDIPYRELVANPLDSVKRIYAHFSLPWSDEYEKKLRDHLGAKRSTGHGKHKYDMSDFGVEELDIQARFPEYRARFGDMLGE